MTAPAPEVPRSLSELVPVLLYRTGAELAPHVPSVVGESFARVASRVASILTPQRRRQVERNLARVSGGRLEGPALRRAVNETFESYGRYWWEFFHLPADLARDGAIEAGIVVDGTEHLAAGLAAGRGVVVALPHLGGWEYGGAWIAGRGYSPAAVVEPVEPPELFDLFADVRRAAGIEIVPLGANAGAELLELLRDNRIITLLCDRDLLGNGVEVEFFGERTTLPSGPALLALRTGAALLPAAVYFAGAGRHRALIEPPISVAREGRLRDDVQRVSQELAYRLEVLIRAAPEQWHLMQPNWPSDRNGAA